MTADELGYIENQPGAGDLNPGDKDRPEKEDLKDQETHPNQVGSGYSGSTANRPSRFRGLLKSRRRKFLLGGGLAATLIGLAIVAFLALVPLKILHIVQNLQNHFFATANNAAQKEAGKLESDYIKSIFKGCTNGSIDRKCNPYRSTNPVSRLWKGWRNAKLESTLATKYGLEFKNVRGHFYMKAPGMTGDGAIVDDFVNSDQTLDEYITSKASDPQWKNVSRSQVRQAVKDSLASETRWNQAMYRFKVGRLLEEKYGIKRCIIFCGTKDKLADNIQAQKDAAKLYLVERVIQPNNEALAVVLKCFFSAASSSTCDPTKYSTVPCEQGVDCEMHGAPENPETDTALRQSLEELAKTFGIADGAALEGLLQKIETDGFKKFLIKYVMLKVFNVEVSDATADALGKAIPLLGWLNMAFQIVHFADKAGPTIKKLTYIRNASAAVALYGMYRTYADEVKDGKANAREVGSFVNSLGPVAATANLTDLKGGTAEAEQTPLYNSLLGAHTSTGSANFKCDSGKSAVGGSGINLTCPEEKLSQSSDVFNALKKAVDDSGLATLADIWAKTGGILFSLFGNLFSIIFGGIASVADAACNIPILGSIGPWAPYCAARDAIKAATTKIIDFAANTLFPTPFSHNMSGGRTFNLMAAGADVSGNDFSQHGLGGQKLSDQQVAAIQSEQNQSELQSYKKQSFFARMFDTQSQYSPVSKLALAIPDSSSQAVGNIASFFTNPFGRIWHSFASIFGSSALADTGSTHGDPFGVPQYGYPVGPIIIPHLNPAGPMDGQDFWKVDHAAFWDAYCEPKNADGTDNKIYDAYYNGWNREAAATIDESNGMPTNTRTNGCLLIEATTGSTGALYDASLLTPDDLATSTGTTTTQ